MVTGDLNKGFTGKHSLHPETNNDGQCYSFCNKQEYDNCFSMFPLQGNS
jgi:hypothetical protein